jgi:hypothetical protein
MSAADVIALSLSVTVHSETVGRVEVVDLRSDVDQLVSLKIGDDRSGVSILGDLDGVRAIITEANRKLQVLAEQER